MAKCGMSITAIAVSFLILLHLPSLCTASIREAAHFIPPSDVDLLEFPLNLEYLEAEFFLFSSLGHGLDKVAPELAMGGPSPVGAQKANLSPFIKDIITQFAYQEVGHVRAIKDTVKGFPRPLLNLSSESFSKVMDRALGCWTNPPFDPYANDVNFLLASYILPNVGLTGYAGANPKLKSAASKKLVAGLLGVESGQDAVIRSLLYEHVGEKVEPYGVTVAEFTERISELMNKLGHAGTKDEGIVVPKDNGGIVTPKHEGAEGRTSGNVLAGDEYSLAYARTPEEVLRILYGEGNEHVPGGFYPNGADGRIAKCHLATKTHSK
ncbi:desiccation-related protein PCC13-62-like [Cucurbita pepo subsp. pepo]|uniref:desiccation-related protein PCC13-62-like n=1 Tax=Cucurbita pepo subsp. pepo TaxID=3664 RepID=UPI000C9D4CD8|nr:desiccation-related protein PCC13-62-like [Cucurbita pepo subsp. pepo]